MKVELKTTACVVSMDQQLAYVGIGREDIPKIEGHYILRSGELLLYDMNFPVKIIRLIVDPQWRGDDLTWNVICLCKNDSPELYMLHGTKPILSVEACDEIGETEQDNYIQVRWLA